MTPTRRHRTAATLVALLAVLAGAGLAAGCGVPLDGEPRVINRTTTTMAVTTTDVDGTGPRVRLYFVDDRGGLVARTVAVQREATVQSAVDTLLRTVPNPPLRSLFPDGTQLAAGIVTSGDLVTVDLTNQMATIGGQAEKQAYAQIVFTVLAFPQYERVRFLIEGKAVAAPTDRENLETVTADDYDPPLNPG